jgi:hypothetical protein
VSDGAAYVRYEAIADFEKALGRFAQAALEGMKAAEITIRRTADQLENRRVELRREIAQSQDEIASADEDEDTRQAQRRLEEAKEALANVRRWQREVEACVLCYKREAQKLEELSRDTTIEARAYLRKLLNDLAAYFALQKDGGAGSSFGMGVGFADASSGDMDAGLESYDPTSCSLPPGYSWVPLVEIDVFRELADVQTDGAFKKVPYDEMRRGFHVLRSEILPAMNDFASSAGVDSFASRDAAANVPYERRLQRVFEAFFGTDPIYLSRGRDAELFSVTSGRHRIKVAADLGWTAVPVKKSDLRST